MSSWTPCSATSARNSATAHSSPASCASQPLAAACAAEPSAPSGQSAGERHSFLYLVSALSHASGVFVRHNLLHRRTRETGVLFDREEYADQFRHH